MRYETPISQMRTRAWLQVAIGLPGIAGYGCAALWLDIPLAGRIALLSLVIAIVAHLTFATLFLLRELPDDLGPNQDHYGA